MGSWDPIKSQIRIYKLDRRTLNLPKPRDFDRFESSNGFRLPLDFRDFAMAFGYGTFAPSGFTFAIPGARGDMPHCDPVAMTAWFFEGTSDNDLAEQFDDPVRARRLMLFADNGANDFYGWDPEDVTNADAHEYGIYLLGRFDTRVLRLATTFRDFVLSECFEGALKADGSGYENVPVGREPRDYPICFSVAPSTFTHPRD